MKQLISLLRTRFGFRLARTANSAKICLLYFGVWRAREAVELTDAYIRTVWSLESNCMLLFIYDLKEYWRAPSHRALSNCSHESRASSAYRFDTSRTSATEKPHEYAPLCSVRKCAWDRVCVYVWRSQCEVIWVKVSCIRANRGEAGRVAAVGEWKND